MDLEKLQKSYPNLTRNELESRWRCAYSGNTLKVLNEYREKMKKRGREHVVSVPLVQILSVDVSLDKADENKPVAIYGRIYGEYDHIALGNERHTQDVYNRGRDEPEIISQNGNLTLTGPRVSCWEFDACMPLHKTTIVVDLWDAVQNVVFAQGSFLVEDIVENDYEQVKQKVVTGKFGYVVVRYIAMPFATLYNVIIKFFHKDCAKEHSEHVVNVNGKIVIRYDNTYGNYSSEEYTIFEKPNFEFEPLEVNSTMSLKKSRYWICAPAYASLVVDWDLWDFDTKRNIFKETVKFPNQPWFSYHHTSTVDDLAIDVRVENYQVFSREVFEENDHQPEVMCFDDESLPNLSIPWNLRPYRFEPMASPSVEVFSVFIGHEKCRPLRLFGVIEASCGPHTFDIFRRQENNAVELLENENILPILNGNGKFDSAYSFKIIFDLKDVSGLLFIKGYVKWYEDKLDDSWFEQQLCSVIPGEHGFAAVHYTIFPAAVEANIEVFYKIKKSCCNVSPVIYGSLVAQYNYYDYSSHYKRDYYRKVLFKRNYEDPLQVASDMKLPLSRSAVMVPKEATLIIEVDLWSVASDKCLSHVFEIEIGCCSLSIDKEEFSLDINLKWGNLWTC